MEIAGLVTGVVDPAGLVIVGVNALKCIEMYKSVATNSRLLTTRFNINKAIFCKWAKRVGIVSGHAHSEEQHYPLLADADISNVVNCTLVYIGNIFIKTAGSRNSIDILLLELNCDVPPLPRAEHKPSLLSSSSLMMTKLRGEDAQQNPKKPHSAMNMSAHKAKLVWTWGGKNCFTAQVETFKALLGQL
jgi:hypothetical protein